MSLKPVMPWLLVVCAVSVTLMVFGAGQADRAMTGLAAGLVAGAIAVTALVINAPSWYGGSSAPAVTDVRDVMRRNIWLTALVYGWGAAAFFAIYSLSGLTWRHWWQYGGGAAIISLSLIAYAYAARVKPDWAMPPPILNALHGLAAGGGLIFLIATDKLATRRGDWAANDIFLFGGIAVVGLCVIAAITQARHSRRPVAPAPS